MGRQAKRVPLDFGWPLKEVWPGYLLPDWLREATCQSCDGSGYSRRARCEREGKPVVCDACDGDGTVERWGGQRAAADQWDSIDPPTGDGWQMWETTSEGSPMSPVFATREALADWLVGSGTSYFGGWRASRDEWLAVIDLARHLTEEKP